MSAIAATNGHAAEPLVIYGPSGRQLASVETPPRGEYGSDRESWIVAYEGGGPDINPILSGWRKYDVYDEMALTDAIVKALLWMERLPIRGATYDLDPASNDGVDVLARDVVARNLGLADFAGEGHLSQSWPKVCDQGMLAARWGCMFEELIWDDVQTWDFNGTSRIVRPLERLAPRPPKTIQRVDFAKGRPSMLTQNLANVRPIPGGKLVYTVLEEEPGRWDGISMLRAAWGPWELKKQLMISSGIAWDRWAAGIPVVRYPSGGSGGELVKAEEIGRSIRTHERAYVAFEGPKPDANFPDGWDLTIEGGTSVLPDPVSLLQRYDYYIMAAGLEQFMALGAMHTGSRAVGQVQDEPFYMAVEAIAGDLAQERQRQVIRRIVDVNFGTDVPAPKLRVSKIQSEDVEKLGRVLADLHSAGFVFDDSAVQNYVRSLNRLPELVEPLPAPAPVEGAGLPAAQVEKLRAAEQRRFQVAFDKTLDRLDRRLGELEGRRQLELPLPAAPIVVPVTTPASITDQQLVAMFERTQEAMLDRLASLQEPPPIQLEVKLDAPGEARRRTAIVSKSPAGETVVEYRYDDESSP